MKKGFCGGGGRNRLKACAGAALVAAALGSAEARATAIPDASFSGQMVVDGTIVLNTTSSSPISQVAFPVSLGERALPDPFVGTGVLSGGLAGANQSWGQVWYYMRISGPSAEVPVIFYGAFQSIAHTYDEMDILSVASSESELNLFYPDGSRHPISENICDSYRGISHSLLGSCGLGYFNIPLSLMTDTVYAVQLYASASAEYRGDATGVIDPSIFVDPTFANASSYTVEVSAGIGNPPPPSPVSEPVSAFMLGAGLLGLASIRRRLRVSQERLAG